MEVNKAAFGGSDNFDLSKAWNEAEVKSLPARTLAYLGDAVYELALRMNHIRLGVDGAGRLHDSLVGIVSSPAQAKVFDKIFPTLDEFEQQLLKTWRNAKIPARYGSGTRTEYAKATALEAWAGYLFLTKHSSRLSELITVAVSINETEEQTNE